MEKTLKGVAYVSVWVLLWGTAASLADYVLLEREAYTPGTPGQLITFFSYGAATVVLAIRLAGRFLKDDDDNEG
ncbi:MAG: hypothetical protein VKN17_02345 [Cyanobacteriota bacterium]|jgi:drug/metabolite transporter (DMT)-like permease|nr:hypothetical protein [Cyanobacteriota bacterium]